MRCVQGMILAEVIDTGRVKVSVRGGMPKGASVSAWIQEHGATASDESRVFKTSVAPAGMIPIDPLTHESA